MPWGRQALTFGALDAGVLVVAEEEALPAEALVAAHHVDAGLLAAAVALGALVQVCKGKAAWGERGSLSVWGKRGRFDVQQKLFLLCTSVIPQLEERGTL